ncbi:NAD(P)H-dependent glycerol-3-phosphate dehydrogenase, partial [gut metagenome]
MTRQIGILGAGTWGTALGRLLIKNEHHVTVWSALADQITLLERDRVHPNLPGIRLPDALRFTRSLEDAVNGRDIIVLATPSIYVRETVRAAKPFLQPDQTLVSVAKGIESDTLMTMSEVVEDVLSPELALPIAALSGPTHAEEVIRDMPSAIVSASA